MKTGSASGLQIAFFTFAVLLLLVPFTDWLSAALEWPSHRRALLNKAGVFSAAALILFGFPRLRRASLAYLAAPIPGDRRVETVLVVAAKPLLAPALAGAYALWHWTLGGEAALAHYVGGWLPAEAELAKAFTPTHMLLMLLIGGIVAPILEELVFRGLLYRAWERQWGWGVSTILTSALFGIYHPDFWAAFLSSVVFVCLYRRTGSLWAPIAAHAATNVSRWYPLMGRLVVPREAVAPGDLASWGLQLSCLLFALVALPAYAWLAREARRPAEAFPPIASHGAIQG